jgi:hypothetical protein
MMPETRMHGRSASYPARRSFSWNGDSRMKLIIQQKSKEAMK